MHRTVSCLVALGSNLGDRSAHLRAGVAMLQAEPSVTVRAISSLYETAPVGGPDNQGAYYNAALIAETELSPADFLATLHRVEAQRERERKVRWGARTLDLDLLTYGEQRCQADELMLPHPRMHLRRFVMVPVCDVAPDAVHPDLGRTMQDVCDALPVEPGDLVRIADDWAVTTKQDNKLGTD